jgi:hypothetical protein
MVRGALDPPLGGRIWYPRARIYKTWLCSGRVCSGRVGLGEIASRAHGGADQLPGLARVLGGGGGIFFFVPHVALSSRRLLPGRGGRIRLLPVGGDATE